jgi:hypothetical protein
MEIGTMIKVTREMRAAFDKARRDLLAAGFEQVCSVMDDGDKSGRIDFGTLYTKGTKREGNKREFWLNYKSLSTVDVVITICKALDSGADLAEALKTHGSDLAASL